MTSLPPCHHPPDHIHYPSLQETAALPSASLGKIPLTKFSSVKGFLMSAFYRALGKVFVECLRKPSAKKSYRDGDFLTNGCFANCLYGRHLAKNIFFEILCRVSYPETLGKEIIFFKILCRVPYLAALGKEMNFFRNSLSSALPGGSRQRNELKFFAECPAWRHLDKEIIFLKILCRVPCLETLGKEIIFFLLSAHPRGTRQTN